MINANKTSVANDSGSIEVDGLIIDQPGANCLAIKSGTMSVKNAVLGIAPNTSINITGGKTTLMDLTITGTTAENGITVNGGEAYLENVTVEGAAARNLNVSKASSVVTGKNVTLIKEGTAGTTLYNKGTVELDAFIIENTTTGYQVDNFGTLTLKNGRLGYGGNTNICMEKDSDTKLYDVTVNGCSSGNAVYLKASTAKLTFDGLTIRDAAKARSLSNGGGKNTPGGIVEGKNLVVYQTSSSTAVANDYGTMTLENVEINGAAYHLGNTGATVVTGFISNGATRAVNNTEGTLTLKEVVVKDCTNIGVNNSAVMTLEDYEITGSYNGGMIANSKTLTLGSGTVTNAGGNGVVNNGTMTQCGTVKASGEYSLYQNGTYDMMGTAALVTDVPVYLTKGHVLHIPEGKLANGEEQKILLNSEVTETGTVLVTTKEGISAEALLDIFASFSNGLFTIEASENHIVAGAAEIQYEDIHVSTWAELKSAVEGAKADSQIRIILDNDIPETSEGTITVGDKGTILLLITDEGKGYTITRTQADSLFVVGSGGVMNLDGSMTVDGGNKNGVTAAVAMLINRGSLTIGKEVVITGAVNTNANNSINGDGSTKGGLSGGAIESGGALSIYGTVTASKSGNGTAVSVIGGSLMIEGANLSNNLGRALRVGVNATATITDSHFDNNSGASGGGALLVDAATVTVTGSSFDNNVSAGSGGSVQLTNAGSNVTITSCSIDNNTSKTNGGAIWIGGAGAKMTLADCTVRNNTMKDKSMHGGAIFCNSKVTVEATGTSFIENKATGSGGVIFVNADGTTLHFTKCEMKDNTSGASGAVICLNKQADVTMQECIITGNRANGTASSGVLHANGAKSTVLFKDCKVNENHADGGYGGVANINAVTDVIMDGGEMTGNTAKYGGAISIGSGAGKNFIFKKGRLGDNGATDLGSQIRFGGAAGRLELGAEAVIYVTDKESAAYKEGMLGLAGAGSDIVLADALREENDITMKGTHAKFAKGASVLSGYDAANPGAEKNTWIANAASRITIVSPVGLYVGTDGLLTITASEAVSAVSEGGMAAVINTMVQMVLAVAMG